jgi:hypothetical protein
MLGGVKRISGHSELQSAIVMVLDRNTLDLRSNSNMSD